jgi:hypothetical protein
LGCESGSGYGSRDPIESGSAALSGIIQELMDRGNKIGTVWYRGTVCVNYNKLVLNLPGKEIVDLHQHFPRKCGHPLSDIKIFKQIKVFRIFVSWSKKPI